MSKSILRWVGAALALAGIIIIAYSLYAYFSQRALEAELTAEIPGQNTNPNITSTPIALAPVSDSGGSSLLTVASSVDGTRVSPSVTAVPTHATPVQPNATAALQVAGTATAIALAPTTPQASKGEATLAASSATTATVQANAPPVPGRPRGTGPAASRLVIPKLKIDLAVQPAKYVTYQQSGLLYSDWDVPYTAAGHLVTTVQPGEIGNAVLSGHHNLTAPGVFGLGVFAGLWNLSVGDEIDIGTADGKTQTWRVKESYPVKEAGEPLAVRVQHAQQVMGETSVPTLTLLTCWNGQTNPLAGNTYRWVIHAELVNIN